MASLSLLQQVELFHLTFLRLIEQQLAKNCYALKGGCNLRFFFKSPRYSEDMDLDAWNVREDILSEKVTKVLRSSLLAQYLGAAGIELENVRAPKQTETTQRWKMAVRAAGASTSVPTKIEFSRREKYHSTSLLLEPVDGELISAYNLFPVLVLHYSAEAALHQKINALLNRSQTQARDIFDISLLLGKVKDAGSISAEVNRKMSDIEDKILSIDYEVFHSQVVAFLAPKLQAFYAERATWESLQLNIIESLRSL